MDIAEIDAASNNGVEEIRTLRDTVKYPPQFGKYKVYIIDEVHMLSISAFNALLKTLEEPPEYVVFILATTEPQKLPATILSRCQRFDFGRISAGKIQKRLREATEKAGGQAADSALMTIARAAEGGMRDALSILDMCLGYDRMIDDEMVQSVLGTNDRAFLFRFGEAIFERNAKDVIALVDQLMKNGKDPVVFCREFSSHIRSMLLIKCGGDKDVLEMTEEDFTEYLRSGENISVSRLMDILDLFLHLEADLRLSASPRISLENIALRCCLRTDQIDAQSVNDRINEIEKRIQAGESTRRTIKKEAKPVESENEKPAMVKSMPERDTQKIWDGLLEKLKTRQPGIYPILKKGMLAGRSGNEFIWEANGQNSIYTQSLESPERKKLIESILEEITGELCYFRIGNEKQNTGEMKHGEESYLDELQATFGSEPIDIV